MESAQTKGEQREVQEDQKVQKVLEVQEDQDPDLIQDPHKIQDPQQTSGSRLRVRRDSKEFGPTFSK